MSACIEFDAVDFAYERKPVLRGFSLALEPGEVVLLAAPNSRGKTTALWLAAGLLRPDRGRVRVLGRDPFREREVLANVGFLADGSPLPEGWTVAQVLRFQHETFGRWNHGECERLMRRFRLESLPSRRTR